MDKETKKIYSEVYEVLMCLGERFIEKIPYKLMNLIKEEKLDSYNPKYDLSLPLEEQNIKEETIDMIALFYLNYWCESEDEKKAFRKVLQENEEMYQEQLNRKYNTEKMFKDKQIENKENKDVQLIEYKKNIFKRIIDKIKIILGINH